MGGFLRRSWLSQAVLQGVQNLKPVAERNGLTVAQFAIAWVLREPNVASAIMGATHPAQIAENARASGAKVDPADFAEAEQLLASAG